MSENANSDRLLENILVDAYGEDEQLWAFKDAFEIEVPFPAKAAVIGEPVEVVGVEYDSNPRKGLRAVFRKSDGTTHEVALVDVEFPADTKGALYQQAYGQWLGTGAPRKSRLALIREKIKETKATVGELDLSRPLDLVVLGVKQNESARCRLLDANKVLTLRAIGISNVVPGEIVTVMPQKHWSFAGHPYLTANITGTRLDVEALKLTPLNLADRGVWNPLEKYTGADQLSDWAKTIITRGPRPQYEMEQVTPDIVPEDFHAESDPILKAVELRAAGDLVGADHILANLLIADLRCLDAYAHLGNIEFELRPEIAVRFYDVGRRIGEMSLGGDFTGVLPWALVDNRPYLRCLYGYGLCCWRLKRFDEAVSVFARMMGLDPEDKQSVHVLLRDVQNRIGWENRSNHE